jgi:hypothetical protein
MEMIPHQAEGVNLPIGLGARLTPFRLLWRVVIIRH